MKGNGHESLIARIPIFDREGKRVAEKEVVSYRGLLARAHEEGLRRVETQIVQVPSEANGDVAIVRATIETNRGTYAGIGDASPANVNRHVAAHVIRMAETRAKARALRDAVNIGVVSMEELGDIGEEASLPERPVSTNEIVAPAVPTVPQMTDAQRRMLFRLAARHGVKPENTKGWLEQLLGGVSLASVTREEASRAIDRLQQGNGETRVEGAAR